MICSLYDELEALEQSVYKLTKILTHLLDKKGKKIDSETARMQTEVNFVLRDLIYRRDQRAKEELKNAEKSLDKTLDQGMQSRLFSPRSYVEKLEKEIESLRKEKDATGRGSQKTS